MPKSPDHSVIAGNREAWNHSAEYHRNSGAWQKLLTEVSASGFSCFDPVITQLLNKVGITGKAIIQLGCNNGRECLSLMGLGARIAVGVDQSSAFLSQARELAALSPHDSEFVEADIHDLPQALHTRFDVALITIGVLNWMPDLSSFFACAAEILRPGGTLVIYETHPFLEVFDPEADNPFEVAESYFRTEPFVDEAAIVYEGTADAKTVPSYWFIHRLGDIFSALIDAKLEIRHFQEYPHSNREEAYDFYMNRKAQLPMCYTLTATKTA